MKYRTSRTFSATLFACFALSAFAGTFTATGKMMSPRHRHAATLLANGKVLVTGGENTTGALATAELYNPATGTFTRTGNMATARFGHTATRLPNGKVLLTGGQNSTGVLATAELFNPTTGTFTRTGSMHLPRIGHTATLIEDGKVLIAGGRTAKAELYDPSTGMFTSAGSMSSARTGHTATLLADGMVLLAGGTDSNGTALGDLFHPASATFSTTATGGTQALWLAAASLLDGRVMLAGGQLTTLLSGGSTRCCLSGPDSYGLGNLFKTSDSSFFAVGEMTTSRAFHTATRLGDGDVLISGGSTVHSVAEGGKVVTTVTPLATAELFNPTALTFTETGKMTTARSGHTATLLGDGAVLVVGGTDAGGNVLSSAELYR
ncbi:MAG TPA: kelch repeat-containing protein [Candidatus Sulfotelmatobacter sp.]|nr:kelch repeat-containing protein [Candidatus Sulfotelmatobacter sp.]